MKISCGLTTILWLVTTGLTEVRSFGPAFQPALKAPPTTPAAVAAATVSPSRLCLADREDDYDAWLEQLDPSAFEEDEPRRNRGGGFPQHDYERDWRADRSNVDEDAVDNLIAERLQARKVGQFDKADRIRDELLESHGVSVWDKERLWRSGCSPSGSGSRWGPGGGRGGGRDRNNNNNRRNNNGRQRRPPQNFGPNGHDYSLSPDAGPSVSRLSEGEIHDLLAERLQYKLGRNFRMADDIQNELYQNGVFVHDGIKEWRADGVGFGDDGGGRGRGGGGGGMRPGRSQGSRASLNGPYEMSKFSEPLLGADAEADMGPEEYEEAVQSLKRRIQDLVDERMDAKMDRDYRTADAIRDDLRQDYNVQLDDRRREWSVGGAFEEPPGPYAKSPYSLSLSTLLDGDGEDDGEEDEEALADLQSKIQDMVDQRLEAKLIRDYNVADAIREDLEDMYNVAVNDRLRLWSIGGNFDPPPQPYAMSPFSLQLEGIDEAQVLDMVTERAEARKQRAYAVADDIKFSLMEEYNIMIDDNLKQWSVGGKFEESDGSGNSGRRGDAPLAGVLGYVQRGGGKASPEEVQAIEKLIEERAIHKAKKDFGKADRIRDRLQEEFNVRMDDRNKEWHIVTNAYVYTPSAHSMSEEDIAFIQKQVNDRALAKLKADYETADGIRDALMDQFAVSIDDRLKEWTVIVDPSNRFVNRDDIAIEESFDSDKEEEEAEETTDEEDDRSEVEDDEEEEEIEADEDDDDDDDGDWEYEEVEIEVEEEEEVDDGDDDDDADVSLESLTVVELKAKLKALGLPVSGRKAELIERLR